MLEQDAGNFSPAAWFIIGRTYHEDSDEQANCTCAFFLPNHFETQSQQVWLCRDYEVLWNIGGGGSDRKTKLNVAVPA